MSRRKQALIKQYFEHNNTKLNRTTNFSQVIREASVLFIDEAPMMPADALDCIDKALRNIQGKNFKETPFGGKVVVLGGDFRQVLPVIRRGSKGDHINASIKKSPLWPLFDANTIHLTENMRTGPGEEEFAKWLLQLGNGELNNADDEVDLAATVDSCITTESLVTEIFGESISTASEEEIKQLSGKVILCPKNEETFQLNNKVVELLDGDVRYCAIFN